LGRTFNYFELITFKVVFVRLMTHTNIMEYFLFDRAVFRIVKTTEARKFKW